MEPALPADPLLPPPRPPLEDLRMLPGLATLAWGLKAMRAAGLMVIVGILLAFTVVLAPVSALLFLLSPVSFLIGLCVAVAGLREAAREAHADRMARRHFQFALACLALSLLGGVALLDATRPRGLLWTLGTALAVGPGLLWGTCEALREIAGRRGFERLAAGTRACRSWIVAAWVGGLGIFAFAGPRLAGDREPAWLPLLLLIPVAVLHSLPSGRLHRIASDLRDALELGHERTPPPEPPPATVPPRPRRFVRAGEADPFPAAEARAAQPALRRLWHGVCGLGLALFFMPVAAILSAGTGASGGATIAFLQWSLLFCAPGALLVRSALLHLRDGGTVDAGGGRMGAVCGGVVAVASVLSFVPAAGVAACASTAGFLAVPGVLLGAARAVHTVAARWAFDRLARRARRAARVVAAAWLLWPAWYAGPWVIATVGDAGAGLLFALVIVFLALALAPAGAALTAVEDLREAAAWHGRREA